jgi:acyl carrier protein
MIEHEVAELARGVLVRRFNLQPSAITPEMRIEDLGVDSLDLLTMAPEFEATFQITIPTKDLMNIRTFGDIVHQCATKVLATSA